MKIWNRQFQEEGIERANTSYYWEIVLHVYLKKVPEVNIGEWVVSGEPLQEVIVDLI